MRMYPDDHNADNAKDSDAYAVLHSDIVRDCMVRSGYLVQYVGDVRVVLRNMACSSVAVDI